VERNCVKKGIGKLEASKEEEAENATSKKMKGLLGEKKGNVCFKWANGFAGGFGDNSGGGRRTDKFDKGLQSLREG